MARRPGCAGAWENAPRTVNNPAAASTRNRKPALRFTTDLLLLPIVSSVVPVPSGDAGAIRARVYSAFGQDASERFRGKRRSATREIFPEFLWAERRRKLRRQSFRFSICSQHNRGRKCGIAPE